jgi:hypothetical protein
MKTKEEILINHCWVSNLGDVNTSKKDALKAMSEVETQTREEMMQFTEWVVNPDNVFYEDGVYYVCDATMEKGCSIKKVFDYWKHLKK